jgi:putative PIN family toxin of toxin-antitoxin system
MPRKKGRIVLDTNIWISFLISGSLAGFDKLISSNNIELLFCEELLQEFLEVAKRPKFRKTIFEEDLKKLVIAISQKAIFVELHSEVTLCRDPKDNYLLALCKDGKATHLISGDKDLLTLANYSTTKIVSYTAYISEK